MTDNNIIKSLECCGEIDGKCCDTCAYQNENECVISLARNALDLINRQKADIETLEANLKFVRGTVTRAVDENERLKTEKDNLIKTYEECMVSGIKKFAEKLKESAFDCDVSFGYGREHYTKAVSVIEIDNLVKEMTVEKGTATNESTSASV